MGECHPFKTGGTSLLPIPSLTFDPYYDRLYRNSVVNTDYHCRKKYAYVFLSCFDASSSASSLDPKRHELCMQAMITQLASSPLLR